MGGTVERGRVDMDVGVEDSEDGTCRYYIQYVLLRECAAEGLFSLLCDRACFSLRHSLVSKLSSFVLLCSDVQEKWSI